MGLCRNSSCVDSRQAQEIKFGDLKRRQLLDGVVEERG
jgi:hypothetical protein